MAQRVRWLDGWLLGSEWADRRVINQNADELTYVEGSMTQLGAIVQRQGQEILWLRAVVAGLVEVLHARSPFDSAELEGAVQAAWKELTAPPAPAPTMTDPYRGRPAEPTAPPERLVLCPQCGRHVPASKTNITEHGEVCDACS
jgi:predicted GNAT family acetyltransferase